MLTPRTPADVQLEIKDPVDPTALTQAKAILAELRPNSSSSSNDSSAADDSLSSSQCNPKALLSIAKRLGDIPDDTSSASYIVSKEKCLEAFNNLSSEERTTLLNIHARVKAFAEAQRKSVVDCSIDIPGGKAGHTVSPCRGTYII
jgi:histidinol dehydrogenase